jgi:beta-lactamase regulating signal transducer with metallopeptidase domain
MNPLVRFAASPEGTAVAASAIVQVTCVVAVAAVVARGWFRRHPAARHGLWLGALLWVLASPAVAVLVNHSRLTFVAMELPLPGVLNGSRPGPEGNEAGEGRRGDQVLSAANAGDGALLEQDAATAPGLPPRPVRRAESRPTSVAGRSAPLWPGVLGALVLVWVVGLFIALLRVAAGWWRVAALGRAARPLDAGRHGAALAEAGRALGTAGLPPIVIARGAAGPLAVGVLRPRVVLPEGLTEALLPEALRDVLIHECAHLLRRDPWVGLLQRLAGAIFWPHPFVHYVNAQLSRAREEVCDNFVIQRGDACGYARTLVTLTELCRPRGVCPAGLGLMGARWTLSERVAGLLDPGRESMTRTTLRTRWALCVLLAATGLVAAAARPGGGVRADERAPAQAARATPAEFPEDGWNLSGIVTDEEGRPVAGAAVRLPRVGLEAELEPGTTAADGAFTLHLGRQRTVVRGLVAEVDNGARVGLVRFDGLGVTSKTPPQQPVRIVVKPARLLAVHVKDAAGAPVAGAAVAAVEAVELGGDQTRATTGPDGAAHLRVAADSQIEWVIGLKSGAGFDYHENYHSLPPATFPPLPADLTLTLDGARTFRIKAVDSKGKPLPGIRFAPLQLVKTGKIGPVRTANYPGAWVTSDEQGIAVLDWLPGEIPGFQLEVRSKEYSAVDETPRYRFGGPPELTVRLRHMTRLAGTVRLPDGRPARGVMVRAHGSGDSTSRRPEAAWTGADGTYALDVPPEMAYTVGVMDDAWTAPVRAALVLQEDQPQQGIDFALTRGTRLDGQVTRGPTGAPAAGVLVSLMEEGPVLPKAYRVRSETADFYRNATTDAQGMYEFRVVPGRYTLRLFDEEIVTSQVEVKASADVVRDLSLAEPAQSAFVNGIVVAKAAEGEWPIPGVRVFALSVGSYGGSPSTADEVGRFRAPRKRDMVVYARGALARGEPLAGFAPVAASAGEVKLVLAPAARVTGRVVDASGKPLVKRQVMFQVDFGSDPAKSAHHRMGTYTNDQGRFSIAYPVGTAGEIEVSHQMPGRPGGARTVVAFTVPAAEAVELADLVVPASEPDAATSPRD